MNSCDDFCDFIDDNISIKISYFAWFSLIPSLYGLRFTMRDETCALRFIRYEYTVQVQSTQCTAGVFLCSVVARRRVLAGAVSALDGAPPVRRVGRGLLVRHRRARCRARGRGQRASREERTAPAALRAPPRARLHPLRQTHLEHSAVRVYSRRMRLQLSLIHVAFLFSNLLGAFDNFALPFMKCFQIEQSPHMNAGFSLFTPGVANWQQIIRGRVYGTYH